MILAIGDRHSPHWKNLIISLMAAYVPVMNPNIPKEHISAFLLNHSVRIGLVLSFFCSQNVRVSNNGGNMSARHEDENAPTSEMNKSNFGTDIATRTVKK